MNNVLRTAVLQVLLTMGAGVAVVPAAAVAGETLQAYSIGAGELDAALQQWASQSGQQVMYAGDLVAGKHSAGLSGQFEPAAALQRLLQGSGLKAERLNPRTVVLKRDEAAPTPEEARPAPDADADTEQARNTQPVNLPEVLVKGSRLLNADIERSIDDPQPYVIFSREQIVRSGATSINDFLIRRVTANNAAAPPSATGELVGDRTSVDLRGLGETQTLILIDGRRVANISIGHTSGQPSLSGIPLSAVERIEILSSSASAIHGGSATGGVINVVLRRDYEGGEISVSHDNSFDTDSSIHRLDVTYGFPLNDGRTRVMLSGGLSESNDLLQRDRPFLERGVEHILRNNVEHLAGTARPGLLPNIRSTTRQNLVLDDGTPLNSPITHAPAGYRGAGSDGGAALVAHADSVSLGSRDANFLGGAASLVGAIQKTKALSASARHSFSERLDGFIDLSHNRVDSHQPSGISLGFTLPADDPRNPFQQSISVVRSSDQLNARSTMFNKTDRASAGLIARLGDRWSGALDYTWSRASMGFERLPGRVDGSAMLADGFDPLDLSQEMDFRPYLVSEVSSRSLPITVHTRNPTLRLGGNLWSTPGGPVNLTLLLEQQDMEYGEGGSWNEPGGGPASNEGYLLHPPRRQQVRSVYSEMRVPLVGAANSRPGLRGLELQAALRYDDYDNVSGNSEFWPFLWGAPKPEFSQVRTSVAETSYLMAFKYQPFNGLTLRASRATGFVLPDIGQTGSPTVYNDYYYPGLIDSKRGLTPLPLPITLVMGSNPELSPEYSRTTSVGVILKPDRLPGFRASLDYTRLEKTNNITHLLENELIDNEDRFPGRVRRGERLPGDPADWPGPIVYLDTTYVNAASAHYEMLDFQLNWGLELGKGYLDFWNNSTWTLAARMRPLEGLPETNLRGTAQGGAGGALNYRGVYGVDYERGDWRVGWAVRHFSSYLVADPESALYARTIAAQGNGGRVPRQIFHDLSASWRPSAFGNGGFLSSVLPDVELSGGIRNVFDKAPAVMVNNPYSYYSYFGDPRMRTYYIQLKYAF